jgi:hypothetical protein
MRRESIEAETDVTRVRSLDDKSKQAIWCPVLFNDFHIFTCYVMDRWFRAVLRLPQVAASVSSAP